MRNKIYYPASQIITGLYTTGKEWMLVDGTEYIGFYHKYIDKSVMTGPEYNKFSSKRLIPYLSFVEDPDIFVYQQAIRDLRRLKGNQTSLLNRVEGPMQMYPMPTLKDYRVGKFTRYFIKRRNKSTAEDIFEVDKDQYVSWQKVNLGIDENLYMGLKMDWKLTGPLKDTGTPPNIEYGVEDTNKRMVILKDRTFPGLINFLTNFTEWSVHSPLVSADIKKMFGTNS